MSDAVFGRYHIIFRTRVIMELTDKQIREAALNAAKEQGATIAWKFPYTKKPGGDMVDMTLCATPKQAEQFLALLSMIRVAQEVTLMHFLDGMKQLELHGAFSTPELLEIRSHLKEVALASSEPLEELNDRLGHMIHGK